MSASDKVVSSRISRFAASSGLGSVGSIEPEQTAHLPLVSGDLSALLDFAMGSIGHNNIGMTYGYVETCWLRLKIANVNPDGDSGGVQMNEDTTARCRK